MTQNVVIVGAGASARVLTKTLKESKADVHITIIQGNKFASLPYFQTLILTGRDTLTNNSTFESVPGADETVYGVAVACADGVLAVKPLNEQTGSKDESAPLVEVPFDVLVAATGSKFPVMVETPGQSQAERQQEIDQVSKSLLSGKNIVIAGGGACGVELAADLLEALPEDKRQGRVTLVCSSDHLLSDQPEYYSEKAKKVLESLGGKIIYNDRVVSHKDTTIAKDNKPVNLKLKSGKELSCEAYFAAFNRGANTSWLTTPHGHKGGLTSKLVDDRGRVIVDEYLKSPVYGKLFALAATNDRKEAALGMNVEAQAKTAAANIQSHESTKVADGVEHAVYQMVGHDTFAMLIPENLPMPSFVAKLCCQWCGFPFNLLCPCWCCAVTCGPVDPMTCGYCCGRPEGAGLKNTLIGTKEAGFMAQSMNYANVGKNAPPEQTMKR